MNLNKYLDKITTYSKSGEPIYYDKYVVLEWQAEAGYDKEYTIKYVDSVPFERWWHVIGVFDSTEKAKEFIVAKEKEDNDKRLQEYYLSLIYTEDRLVALYKAGKPLPPREYLGKPVRELPVEFSDSFAMFFDGASLLSDGTIVHWEKGKLKEIFIAPGTLSSITGQTTKVHG